jgi:hypothetical protein
MLGADIPHLDPDYRRAPRRAGRAPRILTTLLRPGADRARVAVYDVVRQPPRRWESLSTTT